MKLTQKGVCTHGLHKSARQSTQCVVWLWAQTHALAQAASHCVDSGRCKSHMHRLQACKVHNQCDRVPLFTTAERTCKHTNQGGAA